MLGLYVYLNPSDRHPSSTDGLDDKFGQTSDEKESFQRGQANSNIPILTGITYLLRTTGLYVQETVGQEALNGGMGKLGWKKQDLILTQSTFSQIGVNRCTAKRSTGELRKEEIRICPEYSMQHTLRQQLTKSEHRFRDNGRDGKIAKSKRGEIRKPI